MKKQHLIIGLAMVFTLGVQNIVMAQNNDINNKVVEKTSIESTEISREPVPYKPNATMEKPGSIKERGYYYSCTVTGVASGSSLNVRSKPSTSGTIIGSFAAGATIYCEYMGNHPTGSTDWWYAEGTDKTSGQTISGYVHADYVTCSPSR